MTTTEPTWEKAEHDIFEFCRCIGFVPRNDMQREALKEASQGKSDIVLHDFDRGTGKTTVSCVIAAWWCYFKSDNKCVVLSPTLMQSRGNWQTVLRDLLPKEGLYWTKQDGIFKQLRYGNLSRIESIMGICDWESHMLVIDGANNLPSEFLAIPFGRTILIYNSTRTVIQ